MMIVTFNKQRIKCANYQVHSDAILKPELCNTDDLTENIK